MSKIIGILLSLFIFLSVHPFPCFSSNNEICEESEDRICEESFLYAFFIEKNEKEVYLDFVYIAKRYVISSERPGDDPLCDEFYDFQEE